MCQEFKSYIL